MAKGDNSFDPQPGATYRFVVNSAEEAVRLIQEKLGPSARVISVKQTGSRGFASLLRAPQLEVIAEVGPAPAAAPQTSAPTAPAFPFPEPPSADAPPKASAPVPPAPSPAPAPKGKSFFAPEPPEEDESTWLQMEAPSTSSTPTASTAPTPAKSVDPLERILSRAGLGESILARWKRHPDWQKVCALPLGEALKEVVDLLRGQWHEQSHRPLTGRVAFFGPPGCGATTALCKALTMDVFFRQQQAVVMKLDGEQPNPTEGLAMFCEALNVPLLRSADELESIPAGCRFYFDATGSPLHNGAAWRSLGTLLGEFYIETRVLVLNAAYEVDLLKRAYTLGREAGATHIVFTHLDEIHHWGKLWDLLLTGGLQPLFFSYGQNVSGDVSEDTFELMITRMLGGHKV